ncbi:TnsA endonuclease N-terminal domain-containing protein [Pseudovibrio japonicus]|nr:TnsA endonuclease N-terminal domain-containing protein [Pseudovibrio japonicus]
MDIREQFPLLPLDQTLRIASCLDLKHPLVVSTKHPNVMTTDFLLTCQRDGQLSYEAVCVKPAEELTNQRTAEKIDIERVFWELLGVRFRIFVLTKRLKMQAANIKWATWPLRHGHYDNEFLDRAVQLVELGPQLRTNLCSRFVDHLDVQLDDAINVMRALIGSKRVHLDSRQDWQEADAFEILATQTLGVGT